MAYQKKQPKIMSDGNIARVGMIVVTTTDCHTSIHPRIGKIIFTRENCCTNLVIIETIDGWPDPRYGMNTFWNCILQDTRKATLEEKKQYWAELAQR